MRLSLTAWPPRGRRVPGLRPSLIDLLNASLAGPLPAAVPGAWARRPRGGTLPRPPLPAFATFLAAPALLMAALAGRQASLSGRVTDDVTGRGLVGVEAMVEGHDRTTETDSLGRYRLVGLPVGTARLRFRRLGYAPVERTIVLEEGQAAVLDLVMTRVTALEDVEVRGLPADHIPGFAERQLRGSGTFFNREDLARLGGGSLADLLRTVRGARMAPIRRACGGGWALGNMRGAGASQGTLACFATVIVDGLVYFNGGATAFCEVPDLSREFAIQDLAAVEYYRTSDGLPPEFRRHGSDCGVLVLWSRRARR